MSDLLATPSIRVTRYLSADNQNVRDYREQMLYLARRLKEAKVAASSEMQLFGVDAVQSGEIDYEATEEQLVRLACTWGDVTLDELQKFVEEA